MRISTSVLTSLTAARQRINANNGGMNARDGVDIVLILSALKIETWAKKRGKNDGRKQHRGIIICDGRRTAARRRVNMAYRDKDSVISASGGMGENVKADNVISLAVNRAKGRRWRSNDAN